MPRKTASRRKTPFAQWLQDRIDERGLTIRGLARRCENLSHARIVQILTGDPPTRSFVEDVVRGLTSYDTDHDQAPRLLGEAFAIAGFLPRTGFVPFPGIPDLYVARHRLNSLTDKDKAIIAMALGDSGSP